MQPLVVARAREAEDYTRGKSDDRDAVLIARLASQLHCYLPELADQGWARLRHLGARRSRLIEDSTACRQQLRDLLEVAWPAVQAAAADPGAGRGSPSRAGQFTCGLRLAAPGP